MYYKILQLHLSKNVFFLKFGTCTRNGNFRAFLVKTYLVKKTLGINFNILGQITEQRTRNIGNKLIMNKNWQFFILSLLKSSGF